MANPGVDPGLVVDPPWEGARSMGVVAAVGAVADVEEGPCQILVGASWGVVGVACLQKPHHHSGSLVVAVAHPCLEVVPCPLVVVDPCWVEVGSLGQKEAGNQVEEASPSWVASLGVDPGAPSYPAEAGHETVVVGP